MTSTELTCRNALAERLVALCAADTTSGREDEGLLPLLELLASLGASTTCQEAAPGRTNVLATWGTPKVLLTTHLDTVPPFLAPRREAGVVHGRGTCDAKGQVIAQLGAIETLVGAGRTGLAWLGVVGEETDALGARVALALRPRLAEVTALIGGEPTGGLVASGQQGVLHLRLTCTGRAAHSSQLERGASAAWPLLDWLARLRDVPLGEDAALGRESWNLGLLAAGVAANVVPAGATAEVFARTVEASVFEREVRRLAPEGAVVEALLAEPPLRLTAVPGLPSAPMRFGSDLPTLRALAPGAALVLAGPGRIEVAHAKDEHLTEEELDAGRALFVRLASHFLDAASADSADVFN